MNNIYRILQSLWGLYLYNKYRRIYLKNPVQAADSLFYKIYHRHMNLESPHHLIEKITWMSLYTDTSLWTLCADKYRMRTFVKEKGLDQFLPKCLGHWENANNININELPNQFVLKANNGCGTVILVKDKSKLNHSNLKKEMNKWLRKPFGYMGAQKHYLSIRPCILAEELLKQSEEYNKLSPKSMVDFKVWCFNGIPESILVVYNRNHKTISLDLFDINWNSIAKHLQTNSTDKYHPEIKIPRPKHLDQMIETAKILAKDFKEVRVDFYETEEKAVIGELTFTSGYGYFTDEYYNYLGDKIDLSDCKKNNDNK